MSKRILFILFISLLFFILVLANYFINLNILKNAIYDLQAHAIKQSSERITKWLSEKIDDVAIVEDLIQGTEHLKDHEYIHKVIKNSSAVADFAYMFIGYEDQRLIASRTWDKPKFYNPKSVSWYQETVANNATTITEPYMSTLLDTIVISICTPTKDREEHQGVLCGVLPLENIKQEILKISLPYDGNAFLVDQNRKILVHQSEKRLFKTFTYELDSKQNITATDKDLKNFIFSTGDIPFTNWQLVLQLDKSKVYEKVNLQLKINLTLYFIFLIVFLWLNLFYNRHQKRSDEKLKVTRTLLKEFVESNERGYLLADENNNITYYNDYFAKLLGINEPKTKNLKLFDCHNFFTRPPLWIADCLKKVFLATKQKQKTFTQKFSFFEDKEKTYLFFTAISIKNEHNICKGIMVIVDDITKSENNKREKREHEDILFQQKKMADLGEMIGAISHQWRQPLNSLSILLCNLKQFKEMDCLDDETFNENINHALSSTNYLTSTIDTFRDFYLPNKKIQKFDLIEAIDHTFFILEPYFKNSGIKIHVDHEKTKYTCYNYKNEFQQIVANLILNAKDVLQEQENKENMAITIVIKECETDYSIAIEDNGPGISKEILDELFTLFKTTKGEKGTGTGLYISKLIARKKLQGDLIVESAKKPTVFLLKMKKKLEDKQ